MVVTLTPALSTVPDPASALTASLRYRGWPDISATGSVVSPHSPTGARVENGAPIARPGKDLIISNPSSRRRKRYVLPAERRRAVRYELTFALEYFAIEDDFGVRYGRGQTREISRAAVRFAADTPIPVGSPVQLLIEWPTTQQGRPVLLRTIGSVLRCQSKDVVVLIRRHMFGLKEEA